MYSSTWRNFLCEYPPLYMHAQKEIVLECALRQAIIQTPKILKRVLLRHAPLTYAREHAATAARVVQICQSSQNLFTNRQPVATYMPSFRTAPLRLAFGELPSERYSNFKKSERTDSRNARYFSVSGRNASPLNKTPITARRQTLLENKPPLFSMLAL